jgi:hypothetical protein
MRIIATDSRDNVDRDEALHELVAKRHLIGTTEELEKAYSYLQQELSQTKEHLTRYVVNRINGWTIAHTKGTHPLRQQQILQEHQEVRDALTKKLIEVETSRDSTESPNR